MGHQIHSKAARDLHLSTKAGGTGNNVWLSSCTGWPWVCQYFTSWHTVKSVIQPKLSVISTYYIMDCAIIWSWKNAACGDSQAAAGEGEVHPLSSCSWVSSTVDQGRAGSPWPAGWVKHLSSSLTMAGFTPKIHTSCCCTCSLHLHYLYGSRDILGVL